jgi:hypothetical protein
MNLTPVSAEFIVKYNVPFQEGLSDCRLIWNSQKVFDSFPEWMIADFARAVRICEVQHFESLLHLLPKAPSFENLSKAQIFIESEEEGQVEVNFSLPSNWSVYFKGYSGRAYTPSEALVNFSNELDRLDRFKSIPGLCGHPIPESFKEVISSLTLRDLLSRKVSNLFEIAEKLPHVFGTFDE